MQLAEFFTQSDLTKYRKQLDLLLQLKASVADKKANETQKLLMDIKACSECLITDFDQFIFQNRNMNETFKYWDTFIHLISVLENLIRSDHEGNWLLHIQSI